MATNQKKKIPSINIESLTSELEITKVEANKPLLSDKIEVTKVNTQKPKQTRSRSIKTTLDNKYQIYISPELAEYLATFMKVNNLKTSEAMNVIMNEYFKNEKH